MAKTIVGVMGGTSADDHVVSLLLCLTFAHHLVLEASPLQGSCCIFMLACLPDGRRRPMSYTAGEVGASQESEESPGGGVC